MELSTFNSNQTDEVIELYTQVFTDAENAEEGVLIGKLVAELINTSEEHDLLGFVALSEGKVIGCIFFSRLSFSVHTKAFILSPVAVNSEHQRQGIGQQLINFAINELKLQGVEFVFTYGDPNYYSKVGFSEISTEVIKPAFTLTYPEGWQGQSLTNKKITSIAGTCHCVSALNKQIYW